MIVKTVSRCMYDRGGRDRDHENALDRRLAVLEGLGEPLDRRLFGALGVADREQVLAQDEDVAPLQRRRASARTRRAGRSRPRTPETRTSRLPAWRTSDAARARTRRAAARAAGPRSPSSPGWPARRPPRAGRAGRSSWESGAGRRAPPSSPPRAPALDSGDQRRGELLRRQVAQPKLHVGAPPERLAEVVQDRAALLGHLKDVLEQILDLEHLVGHVAENLLKTAMLLAGAVPVEDVVEQQLLHHGRHHAVDLRPGQVDQDRLELSDFRSDSEAH